ncbi:MAG: hypothetical protein MHM6MM_001816 [Cercozoa sp. M6MM]
MGDLLAALAAFDRFLDENVVFVVLSCFAAAYLHHVLQHTRSRHPPVHGVFLPFFGALPQVIWHKGPAAFVRHLWTQNENKKARTVHLAGSRITWLFHPADCRPFLLASKRPGQGSVDFFAATAPFVKCFGGTREAHSNAHLKAQEKTRTELQPAKLMNFESQLCEKVHVYLHENLQNETADLMDTVSTVVFDCVTPLLLPEAVLKEFELRKQELRQDLNTFDRHFEKAAGVVGLGFDSINDFVLRQTLPEWHTARERLLQFMQCVVSACDDNEDSLFGHVCRISGQDTGLLLALLWALHANQVPTVFWALKHLSDEPSVMSTLRKDPEQLSLSNVIEETLRLHAPFIIVRKALKEVELPFSRTVVPEGNLMAISPTLCNRSSDVYDRPDKFDPFRFNKMETHPAPSVKFASFGVGAFQCPGRHLGYRVVHILLKELLANFDFAASTREVPIDATRMVGTAHPVDGFKLSGTFVRRVRIKED